MGTSKASTLSRCSTHYETLRTGSLYLLLQPRSHLGTSLPCQWSTITKSLYSVDGLKKAFNALAMSSSLTHNSIHLKKSSLMEAQSASTLKQINVDELRIIQLWPWWVIAHTFLVLYSIKWATIRSAYSHNSIGAPQISKSQVKRIDQWMTFLR